MNMPLPLRHRFTLLAMLLGVALSGLASAALLEAAGKYEYTISNEILRGQAEDYGQRLAHGQPVQLPRTQRLRGYRLGDPALPSAYATYPLGVHEDPQDEDTHVGVFDTVAGRLVFIIDLGDIEALEQHLHLLVVAMVVLGTSLAGGLGWLLAGIALKPVRQLAEEVEALPVRPRATQLAAEVSDDDLGRLARAIDGYQARLLDADTHEQAFLADASHELRTPLAVIQGALEVLQDDPAASPAQQARLARLERGSGEMQRLLEAMLAAARRKPLQMESIDSAALLQDAAEMGLAGKPAFSTVLAATGELYTAPREALLLLAGVARRLLQPYASGMLQMTLAHDHIVLCVCASDAVVAAPAAGMRADIGTGSALLDRLAVRLGWQVRFDTPMQATLLIGAAPL